MTRWSWWRVLWARQLAGEDAVFRSGLMELTALSTAALREQMSGWDRIQTGRGVGTVLESAYYSATPSAEHAVLFSRVGTLMSRGEQRLAAEPGTRREMVDRLQECDMTWLDLGELRDRVRAV